MTDQASNIAVSGGASAGPAPLVRASGVTLQYKTPDHLVTATYRVSFDIFPAERYVILGPSGCGKSTILKAIAGFIPPVEGEILLKGKAAGSIQLTLRNPLDDSDSRHKVVAVKAPVRPALPAQKPNPGVTVIRGTKVDQQASRN